MRAYKKLLKYIIIALMFVLSFGNLSVKAEENLLKVSAGTFLKVLNLSEISTLTADEEDEVVFLNTHDMYLYESNVIPANTKVYGEIETIYEPVAGRDAAIKILIYKMITPDKKVYKVKGHIYSENDNFLGGKQTSVIYYRKVPHYIHRLQPMLQVAPVNVFEEGKHTVILPGAELTVIIEDDIIIK